MFSSYGYVKIDTALRISVDIDFIRYYQKLFNYYFYNTVKNQLPAHQGHISVILPKIHKNIDIGNLMVYNDLRVDFEYNPEDITITHKNVWMAVKCKWAEDIKRKLDIIEKDFWGFHIVICNFKFNG